MRVRIRRFGELRLARESRETERLEVPTGQRNVQSFVRGDMPPASPESSGDPERPAADSPTLQLAIHRPSAFPLSQHEHTQASVKPLVHLGESARRVSEAEIGPPPR